MPRGRGVGVAKSLEIGHPSKNWNARFGQELLVLQQIFNSQGGQSCSLKDVMHVVNYAMNPIGLVILLQNF